jgi:membrane carboxypeptidase/penicillin-binding protein
MSKVETRLLRLVVIVAALGLAPAVFAAHVNPRRRLRHLASSHSTTARSAAVASASAHRATITRTSATGSRHRYHEHFFMSSFADGITGGDITDGEDPVVRQAAIDALGNMNGTVVAIEPTSGRVLAMVNQKLALSSGAQPCSTIKLSVALAALSEGLISKDTPTTHILKSSAASWVSRKSPSTLINTAWENWLAMIFRVSKWARIPMR